MIFLVMLATGFQAPATATQQAWAAYTSKDGNFVVDFPGKPTKTFTRAGRSGRGQVKIIVAQCDTPDVLYTVQKIEVPQATGLKPADMEAILDYWRDDLSNSYNGKIVTQKKLRLDSGGYGRDFSIEGRPDPKAGLSTIRVRAYLAQKVLYMLIASTAADRDLPEDAGHFFGSFTIGKTRAKKSGPRPEVAGTPLGKWGDLIDPDKDCKVEDKGSSLEIAIPGTHHDLNADNDKLNAPRVVREVTGDFTISAKVAGAWKPGAKSTNPKAVPYIGAGILVWQDSENYIFLGRAAINRKGKVSEFAAFEEREWGTRGALNNRGLDAGDVYLKVERRNNRILGYTSKDGKTWSRLESMEPSYPSTLKVGLYAINGAADPMSVQFQNFSFSEGKGGGSARRR